MDVTVIININAYGLWTQNMHPNIYTRTLSSIQKYVDYVINQLTTLSYEITIWKLLYWKCHKFGLRYWKWNFYKLKKNLIYNITSRNNIEPLGSTRNTHITRILWAVPGPTRFSGSLNAVTGADKLWISRLYLKLNIRRPWDGKLVCTTKL